MKKIFVLFFLSSSTGFFTQPPNTERIDREDYCTVKYLSNYKLEGLTRLQNNLETPSANSSVNFLLYTRKNPNKGQQLYTGSPESIQNSNFNSSNPIRILVHGFQQNIGDCFNVVLRNAYLEKGDFNVIVIDWSKIATQFVYAKVITYFKAIADVVNGFVRFLNLQYEISFDNIYLIGHSLGAHLAGVIGRRLNSGKYNTIFGLDPAGPSFDKVQNDDILKSTDAKYVETIHTDMNKFGFRGKIGNASIYPDYGFQQSRCISDKLIKDLVCDHNAAFYYLAESLNKPKCYYVKRCYSFQQISNNSCQCDEKLQSCNQNYYQLGGEPSEPKNGIFYINIALEKSRCVPENIIVTQI